MPALRVPAHRILVQYAAGRAHAPVAARIHKWAREALSCTGRAQGCEVTVRIVDEAEGIHLNRTYRGRDRATNVLSFAYTDIPPQQGALGDIALCAPVVAAEAKVLGCSLDAHWAHLVVHGIMHLCGHNHERPEEAVVMEALEVRALANLGYGDPY